MQIIRHCNACYANSDRKSKVHNWFIIEVYNQTWDSVGERQRFVISGEVRDLE